MDIIGPLPRIDRGNHYILTVVDHFTKHVEAYPLQDQKAVSVARVFLNEFVSRYGVPYVIHTNQGTNLELICSKKFASYEALPRHEQPRTTLSATVKSNE